MLRDRLVARLKEMGEAPDHQRLAAEVLGIRGASPELARRLVAQALVVEDRQAVWQAVGERVCREAPPTPGVYTLRDAEGRALYVGKAVNLRRRLRAHFARRRWRAIKPGMSRAVQADWREVGSDIEALLREAALIEELRPTVNVQLARSEQPTVDAGVCDLIVVAPSVAQDSVELICACVDGRSMIQRTRRDGSDLAVHARRLATFFRAGAEPSRGSGLRLAAVVFAWLRGSGRAATRLCPGDAGSERVLRARLAALVGDPTLFAERIEQRAGRPSKVRGPGAARPRRRPLV
jgi:hypothetical protein